MPVKVVDVPSTMRMSFHPSHESNDIVIAQVVRK
jgi:hypothetical protein